jgi:hypothetical protein
MGMPTLLPRWPIPAAKEIFKRPAGVNIPARKSRRCDALLLSRRRLSAISPTIWTGS